MRLFIIKRISDGTFLRSVEAHYSAHRKQDKSAWSNTPQMMLRTADGVAMNLRKLCSTPYWPSGTWGSELGWKDFDSAKLALFEVVCMDVDIVSMKAMPATEFAQVEAVENIPLTRAERRAA